MGVCGEAAADPLLATALVGMGVTSLSMASAAVRPVAAQLAEVCMDLCEQAAEAALAATDPPAGRNARPRPPHLTPTPPIRPSRLRGDRTQFRGRIGWGVVADRDSRGEAGDGERSRDRNR